MYYKAVDVLHAVHDIYLKRVSATVARDKTRCFMRRCGVDGGKPKEQLLSEVKIHEAARDYFFDGNTENELFKLLEGKEVPNMENEIQAKFNDIQARFEAEHEALLDRFTAENTKALTEVLTTIAFRHQFKTLDDAMCLECVKLAIKMHDGNDTAISQS